MEDLITVINSLLLMLFLVMEIWITLSESINKKTSKNRLDKNARTNDSYKSRR